MWLSLYGLSGTCDTSKRESGAWLAAMRMSLGLVVKCRPASIFLKWPTEQSEQQRPPDVCSNADMQHRQREGNIKRFSILRGSGVVYYFTVFLNCFSSTYIFDGRRLRKWSDWVPLFFWKNFICLITGYVNNDTKHLLCTWPSKHPICQHFNK